MDQNITIEIEENLNLSVVVDEIQVIEDPVIEESEPEEVIEEQQEEPVVIEQEQEQVVEEQEQVVEEQEQVVEEQEPEQVAEEQVAEEQVVEEQEQVVEVVDESNYQIQEPEPEKPVEEPVLQSEVVPKLIFIVPYRDRKQQQIFFQTHMNSVLEDIPQSDYKIYYSHQTDARDFNRGAIKNIGFLAMKNKYPNDYKNITFVFNDVDTMPITKGFFNYETGQGVVKHFYGYTFSLGGIISIKGADFEKVLGFPNFWAWGYEDNMLQSRVLAAGLTIDRNQYYPIMDKNIFQMKDGLYRVVNRKEFDRAVSDTQEGLQSITNLEYSIDEESGFINVRNFNTGTQPDTKLNIIHDLRNGLMPFVNNPVNRRRRPTMTMTHF